MPAPSLKEFAQAIPVCEQTSGLAAVLDIFRSSGCDTVVVLSEQQYPLGVVNFRQVMPHLISSVRLGETPATMATVDFQKPLYQLEPPIIEPLPSLPAQMSLSQFWPYIQESGDQLTPNRGLRVGRWEQAGQGRDFAPLSAPSPMSSQSPITSSQHWALVDEEGKFLGLLNSWLVLKFLAQNLTVIEEACANEQPQPTSLLPLVQLLEQLPLPLSLQTSTGQVLAENHTWRQQIGTSPNLSWVRCTTAAMLDFPSVELRSALRTDSAGEQNSAVPDGAATRSREAKLSTPTESPRTARNVPKHWHELSAQASQSYCALDTPCMAATVSQRQVILSAPPISKNHQASAFEQVIAPVLETGQHNLERTFSFVKIPMPPSVTAESGRVGERENRQTLTSGLHHATPSSLDTTGFHSAYRTTALTQTLSPPHPLTSNLWLVLAQDTTEQQQVAKELAAKNADLVQLNRLKDEFLACISHELKTPLTAVLGLSTLLKDQTLGPLNERQARYARLIYQSGRQLMTVVNDILDLTRMETGQLELTLEQVPIQYVCDRAYAQVQQLQTEKEQEEDSTPETHFTLEIEPGLDTLIADELRLRQMLVHLLSNALKFTESGAEIGLRVNCWDGWIAFTVWDTGIGIPPEKQHLIFQKFQQLEQPLTRRHEGTGLGLVLTQHLARLHGGDVSFISKQGEGSQFTLLLPPCPPQGREQENVTEGLQVVSATGRRPSSNQPGGNSCGVQPTNQTTRNRLVLIVETVPRYLERLTEQLKNLAYRVVIARSGTEAIEKARSLQPCAVLLNPLLPKLSGWDVLTLLKSDSQTRHIPVFVTATQAEKQQASHHKADGFLNLPVQEQALLQSLSGLGKHSSPTPINRNLTILHLKPDSDEIDPDSSVTSSELTDVLNHQHSELNCRVLEADDLEQAELLARVWHPDVVLLDSAESTDTRAYLEEFSSYEGLTSLPLVTLDHKTTEAANQVTGLSVYPCLAPDNSLKVAALLQVIQVAAGMSSKPSILVIDIGELEDKRAREITQTEIQSPIPSSQRKVRGGQRGKSKIKIDTPLTPHASWLQALGQYLQTAGFRSVLSCSWEEVYHQLQEQNFDLVLMRLRDISDASVLIKELGSLTQMPNRPPILVLDHRVEPDSHSKEALENLAIATPLVDEAVTGSDEFTSELELLLRTVATQILPGASQSMTQLLDQIYQALSVGS